MEQKESKSGTEMACENIQVAIRVKPLIKREKNDNLRSNWQVQNNSIYQIDERGNGIGAAYHFDHVFENISNRTIYVNVVKKLVVSSLEGFNSTIFAYGQTSSGKTYTMFGSSNDPGIVKLSAKDIFAYIKKNVDRRYLIRVSYIEIYNEKIIDLLDPTNKVIRIREDCNGNHFVTAKEEVVSNEYLLATIMAEGNKNRKIGGTDMNERSSRSHTIFRIIIESDGNSNEELRLSHLNLVDLAGSERVAQTKAIGVRLKEGIHINKSLLTLSLVIKKLSEGDKHINFRDSKLTRLLQHALGGNTKTLIIANVSTTSVEETSSTLSFAQRAKIVKNKPIVNSVVNDESNKKRYTLLIEKYKRKVKRLKVEQLKNQEYVNQLQQQIEAIQSYRKLDVTGSELKDDEKLQLRQTKKDYSDLLQLYQNLKKEKVCSEDKLKKKIQELISENKKFKKDNEYTRNELQQFGKAQNNLEQKIIDMKFDYEELEHIQSLNISLKNKLDEQIVKCEQLSVESQKYLTLSKASDEKIFELTEQSDKADKVIEKLKRELIVEKQHSKYIEQDLNKALNDVKHNLKKILLLETYRKPITTEHIDSVNVTNQNINEIETKTLKEQIDNLNQQITKMEFLAEAKNVDLRNKYEELEKTVEILNEDIAELVKEKNETVLEKQNLQEHLKDLQEIFKQYRIDAINYNCKLTQLATEKRESYIVRQQLESKLRRLKRYILQKGIEQDLNKAVLKEQIDRLNEQITEMELEKKILKEILQNQLDQVNPQNSKILAETEAKNVDLRNKYEELEKTVEILNEDIAELVKEKNETVLEKQNLQEHLKDLQEMFKQYRIDAINYNCKLTQLATEKRCESYIVRQQLESKLRRLKRYILQKGIEQDLNKGVLKEQIV